MPLDIRAVSTSSTLALSYLCYTSVRSNKHHSFTKPATSLNQRPATAKQRSPEQIYCIVKEPSLQNDVTSLF